MRAIFSKQAIFLCLAVLCAISVAQDDQPRSTNHVAEPKTDSTQSKDSKEKSDDKPEPKEDDAAEKKLASDEKQDDGDEGDKQDDKPQLPPVDLSNWVDGLKWRTIGPGSMGGRIVDLAVVESDPNVYYVGTASGGVFKTINRGITFSPIFDSAGGSLSIGDVCIAPSNANIVWVGTGEHNARNSVSWGDGVYKSTDGGKTWKKQGLERSFQIGRIAIHPQNPDVVFVGAVGRLWGPNPERGLFKSTDGGETWRHVLAVDDKTGCIDVSISPGDPDLMLAAMYQRQRDAIDGGDPAQRWGPGSGLYRSTDGGENWLRVAEGLPTAELGRIGIAWSRQNPQTAMAIVDSERIGRAPKGAKQPAYMGISGGANDNGARLAQVLRGGPSDKAGLKNGDVVVGIAGKKIGAYRQLVEEIQRRAAGEVVKLQVRRGDEAFEVELEFGARPTRGGQPNRPFSGSQGGQQANVQDKQGDDGFETGGVYKSVDGGQTWTRVNNLTPRPFYYSQIHIDPRDEQNVYVLGVSLHASTDGGATFRTTGRGVHPDHHALWIDPQDNRHILLGCDGGLYETHDRMQSWEFIHNLPIGQFYHVTVDSRRMYRVYGGLQDNGSWGGPSALRSSQGPTAEDWFPVYGGDGFVCRVDSEEPDIVYYEMQYGGMGRVDLRSGRRASIRPPREQGKNYRFNWKTPFILSSHNPRIFMAAGNYVFRSLDRGDDLRIISPEITREKRGTATALAESPRDPNVLYVGTDDGLLWVTRDGGHEWSNISDAVGISGRWRVSSIECSRYAAGRAYATFDGHYYDDDAPHALVTEDYGKTWRPLTGDLPSGSCRVLREDLVREDLLYLGTEFGAWASLDRGKTWASLCTNLPPVAVHELAQHRESGELVAGTHGRGIWILDITPLRQLSPEVAAAKAQVFQPSDGVLWSGTVAKRLFGSKRFVGENRPLGAVLYVALAEKANKPVLKIVDISGQTVRRLPVPERAGLHRVVWDLRRDRNRNSPFGAASTAGMYRVVLTLDGVDYTANLQVTADPDFPDAPTMLEMEEAEYFRTVGKEAELSD